jgi:hypothetical protein
MQSLLRTAEIDSRMPSGSFLPFSLHGDTEAHDIYNPSTPFAYEGKSVILARVEQPGAETDTEVCIFDANRFCLVGSACIKAMQDPYHLGQFFVDGKSRNVFGGVRIVSDAAGEVTGYKDIWYTCPLEQGHPLMDTQADASIDLDIVATGIEHWKDTRAFQLSDRVAVFPRPQSELGGFGGLGSIGYFESKKLEDVTADLKAYAERADKQTLLSVFEKGEWGGVNQVLGYNLNGTFRLIGHRAKWVERGGRLVRDYEAVYFEFNKYTRAIGNLGIIATADDFEPLLPKQLNGKESTLGKVVFPAGVAEGMLFAGVGDRKITRKAVRLTDH